jgi:hypothetical protein
LYIEFIYPDCNRITGLGRYPKRRRATPAATLQKILPNDRE